MNSAKILTIGVPTFNRAFILRHFLICLQSDLSGFEDKIKVIISDNCSTDNTREIVGDWISHQDQKIEVKYIKNESNIGISRNIISLYYLTNTPYFMILGDDDRVNSKELSNIVSILDSSDPPSAIIQSLRGSKSILPKEGYLSFNEVISMFYEFGNAWSSIVDTGAAIKAIESRQMRAEIEKIVWPQTVIGYLLIFDLANFKKPYVFNGEIGFPISKERHSIDTSIYWIKSLNDLLIAASIVDECIGGNKIKKYFLSFRSRGFIAHVKAIFMNNLIENSPMNIKYLKDTLKRHYGFYGLLWNFIFQALEFKRIQIMTIKFYCLLFEGYSFAEFDNRLNSLRKKRLFEISKANENNKRYGNWF